MRKTIPPGVRSCGGIWGSHEDWMCQSWEFFNLGNLRHRGVQSWTCEASCLARCFRGHHTGDSVHAQGFTDAPVTVARFNSVKPV